MTFNRKSIPLFMMLQLVQSAVFAQSTVKIHGQVVDAESGRPLEGTEIIVLQAGIGTAADRQGLYAIEDILAGDYTIRFSHIGYSAQEKPVLIRKDRPVAVNAALTVSPIQLRSVRVSSTAETMNSADSWEIGSEEIEHSNALNAGELIGTVPGVELKEESGPGSAARVSIRGSHSNQVLVLLDGVKLNNETTGDADLSVIPLRMVERIVVEKTGGSQEAGSGAIGGVVRITTRKTFRPGIACETAAGSFGYVKTSPVISHAFRGLSGMFSYQYARAKNDYPYSYILSEGINAQENRINADIDSHHLFGKLGFEHRGHILSVHGRYTHSWRGLPGKIDGWTPYARSRITEAGGGLVYRYANGPVKVDLSAFYTDSETLNDNQYTEDVELKYKRYPQYRYTYDLQSVDGKFGIHADLVKWLKIRAAFDYRNLHYGQENYLVPAIPPVTADETGHGASAGFTLTADLPGSIKLIAEPGLRFDMFSMESGSAVRRQEQWSPGCDLYLSLGETNRIMLKGSANRGFRMPTFADLFYQDVRVEGSPDLLPEKSLNLDATLRLDFIARVLFSAEYSRFRNRVEDMIIWRLGSFEVFRPFNNDAEITGHEILISASLPKNLAELDFSYTQLNPLNKFDNVTTFNKLLPFRPQTLMNAGIAIEFHAVKLRLDYRHVGRRFVNEANTKELDPYDLLDLQASFTINLGPVETLWKLALINALNREYQVLRDMPMPGRQWRAGVSLSMQ